MAREAVINVELATNQLFHAFFYRPITELSWPSPHYLSIIKTSWDPSNFFNIKINDFFHNPLNLSLLKNVKIDPTKITKTETEASSVRRKIGGPHKTYDMAKYDDYPKLKELILKQGPRMALDILDQPFPTSPSKAKAINAQLQARLMAVRVLDEPIIQENRQADRDGREAQIDPAYAEHILQIAEQVLSSRQPNLMPIEEDDYAYCNSPELFYSGLRNDDDRKIYEREVANYRHDLERKANMVREKREMLENRADWAVEEHITALHTRLKSELIGTLAMLPSEYQERVNDILIRNITNIENEDVAVVAIDQIARYWNFYTQSELAGFGKGDRRYLFNSKPVNILLEIAVNDKRPEVIRRVMHLLEDVTTPIDKVHKLQLVEPYQLANPTEFIAAVPEITRTIVTILRNNENIRNEDNGRGNYIAIVDYGMRYIERLLTVATKTNGQEAIVLTDKDTLRVQILAVKAAIQSMADSDDRTNCLGAISVVLDQYFT